MGEVSVLEAGETGESEVGPTEAAVTVKRNLFRHEEAQRQRAVQKAAAENSKEGRELIPNPEA